MFLLAASYYFYMCWHPTYVILIIFSTLLCYFTGLKIADNQKQSYKRAYLALSIFGNLIVLFFFKYFDFFNASIKLILNNFNIFYNVPTFQFLLPVGISFYTFQALSYTIDIYRGEKAPEKHLGIFALYVSFFPQLVAGPIERSTRLIPQFFQTNRLIYANMSKGIKLIIWGFFLKLVVADRAAIYVNAVYGNAAHHNGLTFIAATVLFAFQIYGDFSGYSNIAVGCAKILGYDLMKNFNRPYLASSIHEFWQRWHISLSTWFRDYFYIPLGGNRVVRWRWFYNLFITFLISGLWHGANWTFIFWGALHGLYVVVGTFKKTIYSNNPKNFKRKSTLANICSIGITFSLVCFSWIFFRANNLSDAIIIIQKIFTQWGPLFMPRGADIVAPVYASFAILFLVCVECKKEFWDNTFSLTGNASTWIRMFSFSFLVVVILMAGVFGGNQFIYFQF